MFEVDLQERRNDGRGGKFELEREAREDRKWSGVGRTKWKGRKKKEMGIYDGTLYRNGGEC